ncbi:CNNM domain-containing protein [Rhodococcus sp. NPDC057529]|uniref:CNNM domain-containing protein n=1 Tax=Rhodococcus sp. NPDC057529 TaxID=3346158 RepID=UPI00366D993D
MIAYLSLILGEFVPKHIALQRSSGVSLLTAPNLDRFATVMRSVIWLLSASADLLVCLLGGGTRKRHTKRPGTLRNGPQRYCWAPMRPRSSKQARGNIREGWRRKTLCACAYAGVVSGGHRWDGAGRLGAR